MLFRSYCQYSIDSKFVKSLFLARRSLCIGMTVKLSMLKILSEIKLNKTTDYSAKIKDVTTKIQTYQFETNGMKYIIQFAMDGMGDDTVMDVSFRNVTAIEKLKSKKYGNVDALYSALDNAKFGLTNTGNSISVFNEVYNVVIRYIQSKRPTYVKYEAVEDNRKKLYSALIKRAEKETSLKFERILVNPIDNTHLTKTSQVAVYKIHYV